MHLEVLMSKRLLLVVVLCCVPLAAWAFIKPARVLETFAGISCVGDVVCTDDLSRYQEASELYEGALQFLASSIAPLEKRPLVIFCTSEACYQSLAFSKSSARSIGSFCIIVSPRGWKPFYVRHEMIHHLQVQQLGAFKRFGKPTWFIEGMAYSLSEDPRPELAQPFQQYRSQFNEWYRVVGKEHLWDEASKL
jgi:hypothetical protein